MTIKVVTKRTVPSTEPAALASLPLPALRARKDELDDIAAGIRTVIEDAKADLDMVTSAIRSVQAEMKARGAAPRKRGDGNTVQSRGGFARAAMLTPEERREQARRAAKARWGTLGPDE